VLLKEQNVTWVLFSPQVYLGDRLAVAGTATQDCHYERTAGSRGNLVFSPAFYAGFILSNYRYYTLCGQVYQANRFRKVEANSMYNASPNAAKNFTAA
jgi:hypothetical protein